MAALVVAAAVTDGFGGGGGGSGAFLGDGERDDAAQDHLEKLANVEELGRPRGCGRGCGAASDGVGLGGTGSALAVG